MSPKAVLIGLAAIIGLFWGAEFIMPGHWDRFLHYMEGNIDALTSWIQ